jgi:hypothetical protein
MADAKKRTTSLNVQRALERYHPSAFLLAAQLVSLGLYAIFDGESGRAWLSAFGVLVLALVVWVIIRSPTMRRITWVLVVPAFVLSVVSVFVVDQALSVWSSLLEAAVYLYAAGALIAYMMEDYRVTVDELFAAGATYTLLAWGFAYLYLVCQIWFPGSFVSSTSAGPSRSFLELLSLSFTNLSATGLSDMVPVHSPARVLVMLEQFAGVGYIAVVVSRLIGMTITRQKRNETSPCP